MTKPGYRWLYQVVTNRREPLPEEDCKRLLKKSLKILTEREMLVIKTRFGLPMTLKETGILLGVSGARVQQIQGKALHKLRQARRKYLPHEVDTF